MGNIFHYTTGAGLLGMLKNYTQDNPNLTMWATHYMFMNDTKEYIYGESVCLDIIDSIETEMGVESQNRIKTLVSSNEYKKAKRSVMLTTHNLDVNSPYIISLSMTNDSLHMWNMYAANGNGLTLNFSLDRLINVIIPYTCVYYNGNPSTCNDLIQRIIDEYQKLSKENSSFNKFQRAHIIYSIISAYFGPKIKDKAYELEHEVRLIPHKNDKKVLFREKEGLIIPYIEESIPFDCVENITVGPTADFERVRESVLILLNSKGIRWDYDKIIESQVPYRI